MKFFPQIQIGHQTQFLREVKNDFGSKEKKASPNPAKGDLSELRKKLDYRLWNCLATRDWERWETVADMYKEHSLPMDEVSYSIMCHGFLLSHHHPSSMALLVLDRMKHENIHPAVIKLNENLLNSFLELSELGIRSGANAWVNVARLAWMSAARLRKKRMQRVRDHLTSLPTEEVLKVDSGDVQRLIESEHALAKVISAETALLSE